ncbi:sensor histidine kinase [Streptomyces hainanensis]|uniref:histidine kinase n=1 Tax=Streptomyces hainanensis TaxID=402648 RepID=A0A4R4T6F2_9ACTN|nr:sensor histidine kinase [Streptomyces hainanensis]TDC72530.1 sensor histidine kinase [Streptomyces hainanensis]
MHERWTEIRRGAGYLLTVFAAALALLAVFPLLLIAVLAAGLPGPLGETADWHRRLAARFLGVAVDAAPPATRRAEPPLGLAAAWRQRMRSPENRRHLRWLPRALVTGLVGGLGAVLFLGMAVGGVLMAPVRPVFDLESSFGDIGLASVPLDLGQSLLGAALCWWVLPRMARWHAEVCLSALEPTDEERLAERVGELTESRAGVLDAHGAELRRIERDLHDGAQARLVAIALRLGVAREQLPEDDDRLATLLREAHEGAEEAMTELRDVIRTIYPPILADRGLDGAVTAVAARSAVPTEVDLDELGELSPAVSAAAYFIVTESLTNAAKHSGATHARVRLTRAADRLLVEVTDDGIGGVDETRGTGVIGIRRRAAALDGSVLVSSPTGGPTAITVELPCGS